MVRRYLRLEYFFVLVIACILIYQLLVYPMVGLADSGDYSRIMGWFGLGFVPHDSGASRALFVDKQYTWNPTIRPQYPSSELMFLATALAANVLLLRHGIFDIRLLGAVYIGAFLLSLLVLSAYTKTLPKGRRLLLYALTAFIFADVGYAAYFNSFYSEPASFISACALVAFTFAALADGKSNRRATMITIGFFVAAALLITAKTQNVVLAVPFAWLGYRVARRFGPEVVGAARRGGKMAIMLPVLLVLLATAYYGVYSAFSDKVKPMNLYKIVFYEILGHSQNPEQDAIDLGLDPRMAVLAGTVPGDSGVTPELVASLPARIGYGEVLKFYARHPGRLLELAARAGDEAFVLRPTYLGNYEESYVLRNGGIPGNASLYLPPDYFSYKFSLWSSFKDALLPQSFWLLIVFVVLNIAAVAFKWKRVDRTPADKTITELHAALIVSAGLQFFLVILGEGDYDIVKHLFLVNLLCEICLVFLVMYAVGAATWIRSSRKKTGLDAKSPAVAG